MRTRSCWFRSEVSQAKRILVAVGVAATIGFLGASRADAIDFSCQPYSFVYAYIQESSGGPVHEDSVTGCPADAHGTSTGPADVSAHLSLSGDTITLSHENEVANATQSEITLMTQGVVSFLAPAETIGLVIDFSYYHDAQASYGDPFLLFVRLSGDGGSTLWVDLSGTQISSTPHQVVQVTGLTPGEELVLGGFVWSTWSLPRPATNVARLSLTVVPESSTALLLALGLGAVAARRRTGSRS